jgi:isopentenyl-diphosphate delta-isomerase
VAGVTPTSKRKADHIRINLEEDVRSGLSSGLETLEFEHQALPELDLREVDSRLTLLGRVLQAPLLISSMIGGTEEARRLNLVLAEAAQARGVAMGLGSQRAAIENPDLAVTFRVRHAAPDILLLANLGAVQLNYGYGIEHCRRAVDMVEADALVLHLNPLQEALQPEGDVNFKGLLAKIEQVCRQLGKPVIAKEVGWGISVRVARQLLEAGVAVIDVAGAGGTSWSQVERHRAQGESQARLAEAFRRWGIPTAEALARLHQALPEAALIASGGLRSGIDIAKCVALGAQMGGMAGPFLRAAAQSVDAVLQMIDQTVSEIRLCQFVTGSRDLAALRRAELRRVG